MKTNPSDPSDTSDPSSLDTVSSRAVKDPRLYPLKSELDPLEMVAAFDIFHFRCYEPRD